MKYLSLPFNLTKQDEVGDDDYFRFEGYLSTFNNVDLGDDMIMKGAFDNTLGKRKVKILYQHDSSDLLGVFDSLKTDENGLFVQGRMPKAHSKVKDVMCLMKCGAIEAMSIGYTTVDSDWDDRGVRMLKEVDLWEGSLVTFPMNPKAVVTSMKKMQMDEIKKVITKRDFERCLRESGAFSKEAAMKLASYFVNPRESEDAKFAQQLAEITKLVNTKL